MSARATPVMQQHARAKRAHPGAVVFFRLGDFYEMFGEDALLASRVLDLTLTSRNRGKPDEVPMAGVPHHAAHSYITRLLELGHTVAICEQMADPALVKGIVPREVVRVITPGLISDSQHLNASINNFLAALEITNSRIGLCLLDLSTAELAAAEFMDLAAALGAISRALPREILLGNGTAQSSPDRESVEQALRRAIVVPLRNDLPLSPEDHSAALGPLAPDAERLGPAAHSAITRALRYARACNPGVDLPVRRISHWDPSDALIIDRTAQSHLELVESPAGRGATLLSVIDQTLTPPGARLLRRRLLAPLTDVERIRRRLDQVELFVVHSRVRQALRTALEQVGDLERLATRAAFGESTPRELGALRDGLFAVARGVETFAELADSESRQTLGLSGGKLDLLSELAGSLDRALVDRPPALLKEGQVFRSGFDSELDALEALKRSGTERMLELEARLRAETAIATLKVRYTRVFGWYIEVSRGQAGKAPPEFRRKQTVATGERYTTPELDDLADRITHAEERHRQQELELFRGLVAQAGRLVERIQRLSARVAAWDVAQALAEVAHRYDYTRPEVDDSEVLSIRDGRHPVVERLAAAGRFVPNDVELSISGERLWLVTGPNMAGKSTFLRQVALIVILAQVGSYVPARSARVGLFDRVLSRVGASDNLSRGESTFMVEMRETAEILRSATRRSLVVLDEIGRGTSTFDGLSIAWAVAEHLDQAIGCRALFATHYHELVEFAETSQHAANHSVSARERSGEVIFLHRLVPGPASKSYGVAVAKLAGLPESILARAQALLTRLEGTRHGELEQLHRDRTHRDHQLDLFQDSPESTPGLAEIIEILRALEIDRLTGLEALQLLAKLKTRL